MNLWCVILWAKQIKHRGRGSEGNENLNREAPFRNLSAWSLMAQGRCVLECKPSGREGKRESKGREDHTGVNPLGGNCIRCVGVGRVLLKRVF